MKKRNKKKILVIDGDNLLHRALHRFGNFTTKTGEPSGVFFGTPFIINSLISKFYPQEIYIVFDGGKASWRRELLPNYKVREHKIDVDYEAFARQKKDLVHTLPYLGIRTIQVAGEEADDIIAVLARRLEGYITIVSSDKDFHQEVRDNVTQWKPSTKTLITPLNIVEKVGYSAKECVDYLTLDGDKSDKIPGVKGMGPKRIRQFLDKYTSIEGFLDSGDTSFGSIQRAQFEAIYPLNFKLISLGYAYRKYWRKKITPKFSRDGFSREEVLNMFRKYEVNLLTKPGFVENFKKLT